MNDKNALDLLNMYITAAQIAKSKNKYEYHLNMQEAVFIDHLNMQEAVFIELFKKAFPNMKDNINTANIAKSILNS